MYYKNVIFTIILILCFGFVNAQDSAKIIREFNINYKSPNADVRIQAIQSLKPLSWKSSINLLLKVFEESNPKVLIAAKEGVEVYQSNLELAKLLVPKGIAEIKNEFGRSYLINALGAFKFPEVNAGLIKLLKVSTDPNVAVPVLEAIGKLGYEESISELIKFRKNPIYARHYGFRTTLFEALIQFSNIQVVEFLINSLEENDGLIAVQTQEYLALVTGSRQTTPENWKKWWAENKKSLEIRKVTVEEVNKKLLEIKPEGEVPYYGMSILAKRIIFIVDTSGSMIIANEKESRLDVAKNELIKVINGLPEKCLVEIVSFSSTATAWHNELKEVNKAFQKEIEKRIHYKKPVGGTNTFEAFEKTFKISDNLEAIYFLSDGAPSMGEIIENDPLLEQISRWNRFHKVQINSIGLIFGKIPEEQAKKGFFEDTGPLKYFLKQVAIENNGQYKIVE